MKEDDGESRAVAILFVRDGESGVSISRGTGVTSA